MFRITVAPYNLGGPKSGQKFGSYITFEVFSLVFCFVIFVPLKILVYVLQGRNKYDHYQGGVFSWYAVWCGYGRYLTSKIEIPSARLQPIESRYWPFCWIVHRGWVVWRWGLSTCLLWWSCWGIWCRWNWRGWTEEAMIASQWGNLWETSEVFVWRALSFIPWNLNNDTDQNFEGWQPR